MSKEKRKMVVTSALPYANGDIHLGHLVEYLQTDFWVRFQKMRGHDCVYVCADDTHGTPIMIRARKENITPEELIERSRTEHFADFTGFEIEFDNYYSTNTPENKEFSYLFFEAMRKQGAISTRRAPQLYCEHDKMFLPDRFVKGVCPKCGAADQYGDSCDKCGQTYAAEELKDAFCTVCGAKPVLRESEHLYFELEPYHEFLRELIPAITAPEVSNKMMEWFDEPLRGWCISRDAPYFGFEIPGHPGKFFYVWMDAPIGYLASLRNWCEKNGQNFDDWWQSPETERYHFIGKDIMRFHCLFWPAMLKTAGFAEPTQVFVHGFLTVNGEKMSKSKGTFIKASTYLKHLNARDLRFYYACKLNGTSDDLDLSLGDFVNRVNSDLVGKITNLASRGAQMLHKNLDGRTGSMDEAGERLLRQALDRADAIADCYERRNFAGAMVEIRDLADAANRYFDDNAPWKLIKTEPEAARKVLTSTLHLFRTFAIYLAPVLPGYAEKTAKLFGENAPYRWNDLEKRIEDRQLAPYEYLATRIEQAKVDAMIEQSAEAAVTAAPRAPAEPIKETIDFDTFSKVDLRVAKVVAAEAVEGADKLLRLSLDIGEERPRNVFAGIRKAYDPAKLVGRSVVMVANLAPRKMRFGLSEGMVLAAGNADGALFVTSPDEGAEPGASVR